MRELRQQPGIIDGGGCRTADARERWCHAVATDGVSIINRGGQMLATPAVQIPDPLSAPRLNPRPHIPSPSSVWARPFVGHLCYGGGKSNKEFNNEFENASAEQLCPLSLPRHTSRTRAHGNRDLGFNHLRCMLRQSPRHSDRASRLIRARGGRSSSPPRIRSDDPIRAGRE